MDSKEVAKLLDRSEYRKEGSAELFARMKAAGLVAVFGASDDLMEFRGAIDNELGAYDGGEAYLSSDGLLVNECESESCPHFERMKESAASITALWCARDDFDWAYETSIPHETFTVYEDGEPYCRGIVFALADVKAQS